MRNPAALLLLALIAINSSSSAQSKTDDIFNTYKFSLFLGPTFNSLKPTASTADNYFVTKGAGKVGFNFGIAADYNINDRYTLFSGVGMDWRGGGILAVHDSSKSLPTGYLKEADVAYRKMQYLSIPLGLKMKAVQFSNIRVFAQTGFDLGILLSQKGNYTFRLSSDSVYSRTKEKLSGIATVVPVTMGWCIGAGAEYNLNDKNSFYFTVLYRNGFIDATAPKTNNTGIKFSDGNIRSNSLVFRIGYFF